jgi:hypothetical protein
VVEKNIITECKELQEDQRDARKRIWRTIQSLIYLMCEKWKEEESVEKKNRYNDLT